MDIKHSNAIVFETFNDFVYKHLKNTPEQPSLYKSDSLFLINFREFEKWKTVRWRILKNTDDLRAVRKRNRENHFDNVPCPHYERKQRSYKNTAL